MKRLPVKYIFPVKSAQYGQVIVGQVQPQMVVNPLQSMNMVRQSASMPLDAGLQGSLALSQQSDRRFQFDKSYALQEQKMDLYEDEMEFKRDKLNIDLIKSLFGGQFGAGGTGGKSTSGSKTAASTYYNVAQMNAVDALQKQRQLVMNKALEQILNNPNADPNTILKTFMGAQEELANLSKETVNNAYAQMNYHSKQLEQLEEGQEKGGMNNFDTYLAGLYSQQLASFSNPEDLNQRVNILFPNIRKIAAEFGKNWEGFKEGVSSGAKNDPEQNWILLMEVNPDLAFKELYKGLMSNPEVDKTVQEYYKLREDDGKTYEEFKSEFLDGISKNSIKRSSSVKKVEFLSKNTENTKGRDEALKKYDEKQLGELAEEASEVIVVSDVDQGNQVTEEKEINLNTRIKKQEKMLSEVNDDIKKAEDDGNTTQAERLKIQKAELESNINRQKELVKERLNQTGIDFKTGLSKTYDNTEKLTENLEAIKDGPLKERLRQLVALGYHDEVKDAIARLKDMENEELAIAVNDYEEHKNRSVDAVNEDEINPEYYITFGKPSPKMDASIMPWSIKSGIKFISDALHDEFDVPKRSIHIGQLVRGTMSKQELKAFKKSMNITVDDQYYSNVQILGTPKGGELEEVTQNVKEDFLVGPNSFSITGVGNPIENNFDNWVLSNYQYDGGTPETKAEILEKAVLSPTLTYDKDGNYVMAVTLPQVVGDVELDGQNTLQYISVDRAIGEKYEDKLRALTEVAFYSDNPDIQKDGVKISGMLSQMGTQKGIYNQAQKLGVNEMFVGQTIEIFEPIGTKNDGPATIKRIKDGYVMLDEEGKSIQFMDNDHTYTTKFDTPFNALHAYRLKGHGFEAIYEEYSLRTFSAEGTGQNPTSSAYGKGQFIEGTFNDVKDMLISDGRSDLKNLTWDQYKNMPEMQRLFTKRYSEYNYDLIENDPEFKELIENNEYLESMSKKGRLMKAMYLAHHQGFAGAKHFLKTGEPHSSNINLRLNNLQTFFDSQRNSEKAISTYINSATSGLTKSLDVGRVNVYDLINSNEKYEQFFKEAKTEAGGSASEVHRKFAEKVMEDFKTQILLNKTYSNIDFLRKNNPKIYNQIESFIKFELVGGFVSALNNHFD